MFNWIKKLQIPKGFYCYQTLKIIPDETLGFRMKVRSCPFYRHIHDVEGLCVLEGDLVDDQCKICGRNDFTDGEIEKMGKDMEKENKRK